MEGRLICAAVLVPVIYGCVLTTDYKLIHNNSLIAGYFYNFPAQHVMDCGGHCKLSNPEPCVAFAYNKVDNQCYIYDSFLTASNTSVPDSGLKTYSAVDTGSFPPTDSPAHKFKRYPHAFISTETACAAECSEYNSAEEGWCLYYTMGPSSHPPQYRCYLNPSPYRATLNVSTIQECKSFCDADHECQTYLFTNNSYHVRNEAGNCFMLSDPAIKGFDCTLEQCKMHCRGIPECQSIGYTSTFTECLLFNKRIEEIENTARVVRKSSGDATSYISNKIT